MKKITLHFLILFAVLLTFQNTKAQTAGFNSTFAVLSVNGSSNQYYDLQATTVNTDFNGLNLGNFNSSNSLSFKGAEHNVYKCGGCDLSSTRVYYRVYKTNSTPGSFSNLNIGYFSGGTNGCGGEDQQWANTGYSVDVLSGLTAGNYTFEVYSDASVSCLGGTVFAGNGGSNYKATFNYCGPISGALPVGEYSIPGCFPTVVSAVTYLNTNGVSGTGVVQFNVASGHTETAPSTGILINGLGTAGNLATGSATTEIIFKKSGTGTNPIITAPLWTAGGTTNGIIKIIGSDYITFDGLTIQENPANTITTLGVTNTMSEVGIGLFLGSATNGAQNNTIKNCTITLNNDYPHAIGIFSTSSSSSINGALAATTTAGTNSNNKIYSNTISNVSYGFYAISEQATATLNETGWDIGGSSAATGNTITFGSSVVSNFGWNRFSSLSVAGIHFRNNAGINVQYNTINSYNLSYLHTNLGGVVCTRTNTVSPVGVNYTNTISNNSINLTNNGLQAITGIEYGYGNTTSNFVSNNNIISLVGNSTGASTGWFYGIKANYPSNSATFLNNTITVNQSGSGTFSGTVYFINSDGNTNDLLIQNNNLQSTGSNLKTTGQSFGISHDGIVNNSLSIGSSVGTGNTISVIRTGVSTFNVHGIFAGASSSNPSNNYSVNYNSITISNPLGNASTYGINDTDGVAATNKTFNNNTINLIGTPGGTSIGQFLSNGTITASNNITTINSASNTVIGLDFNVSGPITAGIANNNTFTLSSSGNTSPTVRGINTSASTVTNGFSITNNIINSLSTSTSTGNPSILGIKVSIGTNNIISGNTIKNLSTATTSGAGLVNGIAITGGANAKVFGNNINTLSSSSAGVTSTLSGIAVSALSFINSIDIYNNIISDLNAPLSSTSYGIVGIACNTPFTTYKIYNNTIKIGTSATPISGGTNFGAVGVGVNGNSASTVLDLRNNIINMNVTPSGNGFATCLGFSSGSANAVPLGLAVTSNSNIYSMNSGSNNYLFAQGSSTASPIVNGFAISGLTPNATNNINNDINFNATCGLYKTFMGSSRETNTYYEDNLVAISPAGVFAPNGTSFAENGAQNIASITTDFNGITRTPTNDRGAIQFEGTSLTFTNPNTIPLFDTVNPICSGTSLSNLPTTSNNGVIGTWNPIINNSVTTIYTFTPTPGQCASTTTLTIVVIPSINNISNVTACNTYTWAINETTYSTSGTYINVSGCTTETLNLTIQPLLTFYQDVDGDGYGNPAITIITCVAPVGYVLLGNDCDDTNPTTNPGATDVCYDGIDNDCNGNIDNVGMIGGCVPITTVLTSSTCGATISNLSVSIYATIVTVAQGYSFKVTNLATNVVQIFQRPVNNLLFSSIPGVTYNTQFKVEVGIKYNNVWQPYFGAPCFVTTPAPISTIGATCGTTLASMNQWINATLISSVSGYRFRVTNTVTNQVEIVTTGLNKFNMTQIPNRTFNTIYFVEVALRNTDGTYLPYNLGCNITTPNFPTTSLQSSQCNYNVPSYSTMIAANLVSTATLYRFRIFNTTLGYNSTLDRTTNTFNLNMFSGLLSGTIYSVEVSVRINGTFGPYGNICTLTTPSIAKFSSPKVIETTFNAIAFPNPFVDNFKLKIETNNDENIQIKIYDMLGKVIENKTINSSDKDYEIGRNLSSGVYNIILIQGENTQTLRVIKR